jgi:hypothetical protein
MISVKDVTAISKAAGFLPPLIKNDEEQGVMDALYHNTKNSTSHL